MMQPNQAAIAPIAEVDSSHVQELQVQIQAKEQELHEIRAKLERERQKFQQQQHETIEAHKRTCAGYERQIETLKLLLHRAQLGMHGVSGHSDSDSDSGPEWIGTRHDQCMLYIVS